MIKNKKRIYITNPNEHYVLNPEYYKYACFEYITLDGKCLIRYFPFNDEVHLDYDKELPSITKESCVVSYSIGGDILKDMLSNSWSRLDAPPEFFTAIPRPQLD
tara:strand:+ start:583 stop:894 length:312 start_codon:yes stop_codon:yes gene_type:complete